MNFYFRQPNKGKNWNDLVQLEPEFSNFPFQIAIHFSGGTFKRKF